MMIKVEAYVREDKFEDVKAALNAIGVNGLTVSQVMGCGIQRGYKEIVRGMQVDDRDYLIETNFWAGQERYTYKYTVFFMDYDYNYVMESAYEEYTGEPGDGKIFTYEIRHAQKIRTKETGYDAIQATE